jgi:xanthine dehydrogenase accessory factor
VSDWLSLLTQAGDERQTLVRVVVASVRGSAPREPGACMLVGSRATLGSIGGGRLELTAIETARTLLAGAGIWQTLHIPLGPTVGQCCGGVVELWLERLEVSDQRQLVVMHAGRQRPDVELILATVAGADGTLRRVSLTQSDSEQGLGDAVIDRWVLSEAEALRASECGVRLAADGARTLLLERAQSAHTDLYLFGAGHVGKAIVPRLAGLPFQVTWVDSRDGIFPDLLPTNVRAVRSQDPVEEARRANSGSAYLVMTHSHALDFELCRTILARGDSCFAGLIGSHTKAARFAHRMAREGMPAERIGRLVCPIGIAGIDSKLPEAIAIGVAAQLLRLREADWDGASAHERGRRPMQQTETPQSAIPIVVHRN